MFDKKVMVKLTNTEECYLWPRRYSRKRIADVSETTENKLSNKLVLIYNASFVCC